MTGAVGCRFDEFLPERTECKGTDTGRYIPVFRNDAFESTGSRTGESGYFEKYVISEEK